MLRIPFDFCPDADYKQVGFFEVLPKKDFKFVPNRGNVTVMLYLSLIRLPSEVDLFLEKRGHKRDTFGVYSTSRVKMIFALPTKVIAFYM